MIDRIADFIAWTDWTATGTMIIAVASVAGLVFSARASRKTSQALERFGRLLSSLTTSQRDTAEAVARQSELAESLEVRNRTRSLLEARPLINRFERFLHQVPDVGGHRVLGTLPEVTENQLHQLSDLVSIVAGRGATDAVAEFAGRFEAIRRAVVSTPVETNGELRPGMRDPPAWAESLRAARASLHQIRYDIMHLRWTTPVSVDAPADVVQVLLTTEELLNDPAEKPAGVERFEVTVDRTRHMVNARAIGRDGTERLVELPEMDWAADVSCRSPSFWAPVLRQLAVDVINADVHPAGR